MKNLLKTLVLAVMTLAILFTLASCEDAMGKIQGMLNQNEQTTPVETTPAETTPVETPEETTPQEHTHTIVVDEAVAPTCTKSGLTEGQHCSECEEVLVPQEKVRALGHAMVTEAPVDPTCTESGLTEGLHCTRCDLVVRAQEVVDALGHAWADATCTAPKTCLDCGETEGEVLGHTYVVYGVADPDCTNGGYTVYICTGCGDWYAADETAPLGHTWVDATCTAPKTCSTCQATEGEALGHTWADATCTAPKTCSTCQATEGEALGHTWADATCTAPKTCSTCQATEGEALGHNVSDETYKCTVCEKSFLLTVEEAIALGNTFEKGKYTEEYYYVTVTLNTQANANGFARATLEGVDMILSVAGGYLTGDAEGSIAKFDTVTFKAKVGCVNSATTASGKEARLFEVAAWTIVEKHAHTFADATCTAPKTCSVCGATEGEALDHTFANATCQAPKTCTVCGATEGELGDHAWVDATCTAPKTCSTCQATEGEALGHNVSDETYKCTVCDKNFHLTVEEAIALGLTFEKSNHKPSGTSGQTLCTEEFYYITITLNQQVNPNGFARGNLGGDLILSVAAPYSCDYVEGTIGKFDTVTFKAQIGCVNSASTESTKEARLFNVVSFTIVEKHEHTFADATCQAPKTCTVCGATEGEIGEHAWVDATCQAPKTCSVCQATEGEVAEHTWVDATCTAPKTCSVCKVTEGEALGHTDANNDYKCDTCKVIMAPAADEALTIKQANALGMAHTANNYTTGKYYVTGVISRVINTTYGNVYIQDAEGNEFYVYGLYSADGKTRYDALTSKPGVGDEITVWGVIGTYDAKAAQMKSGWIDEIVACNHEYVVDESKSYDATCKVDGVITKVCSVCNLNTITETIPALGHDTDNGTCGRCGEEIGGTDLVEVTKTITFDDKSKRTSYSTSKQVWEENGIIVTNDKSASTSNVGDYVKPARFYASSKLTITADGAITKIVFDCNSSSYATALKNSIGTVTGATVTVSSDKVTVTFSEAVDSFVIAKLTAQVRMDGMTITYLSAQ